MGRPCISDIGWHLSVCSVFQFLPCHAIIEHAIPPVPPTNYYREAEIRLVPICRNCLVLISIINSNTTTMVPEPWINTLRPRRNGHFADDTFKRIFFNENIWIPIKISLKFVPNGSINNIPALVQIMAWRRPGDKPLSDPMMFNLPWLRDFTRSCGKTSYRLVNRGPGSHWRRGSSITCVV